MMGQYEFRLPQLVLYGPNSLDSLGASITSLKKNKALIVTDQIMRKMGYVDKLLGILQKEHLAAEIFDKIGSEPTDQDVAEGINVYHQGGCDFIIGLGGGSPIDAGKAIGIMASNPGKISDYMGAGKVTHALPPLVAISTTAGTGSEVTKFTIITDTEKDVKMLIASPHLIPAIAVSDPLLTLSVPAKITAATGIDAFCHAIEAYVSKKSQPVTDTIALESIRLISRNIRLAWSSGDNIEARSNMMRGATLAGIAFSNSSVTLIHGMSRPIGACFHVPHGISNAVLLPVWAEFSCISAPQKFANIAEAMGENINGLSLLEASDKACTAIRKLCQDIQIPTIRELDIDQDTFERLLPKMADDAMSSGSPGNNPRSVTKEEIIRLYKKAW